MNILAIDTAGRSAAVAVMQNDRLLYEQIGNTGLTHSETLLPMVDAALRAAGLTCDDIDLYGVTNGPGSFTGLRIGLAAVKGWRCRGRPHAAAYQRWPHWPLVWPAAAP